MPVTRMEFLRSESSMRISIRPLKSEPGCRDFQHVPKKEGQLLVGLFAYCRQHTSCLVMLLWPIDWVTHDDDSFEWDLEPNQALCQGQSVMQSITETFDAAGPVVWEPSIANGDIVWSLWQAPKGAWLLGFPMRTSPATIILYLNSSYWNPVET